MHPLLYEINSRCWLRELSDASGQPVTLANVPADQFEQWQRWGLTHIWLMGVWTTGPRAREQALSNADLRRAYDQTLPGWTEADVAGSPYAIADYRVPAALGGEEGLAGFRKELNRRWIKLILDFVPNHLGLDHAWLEQRPELFVQSPSQVPDVFAQRTTNGTIWIAHGKDPYFPGWTDTAQLDYRRPATRSAMTQLLASVAARCDGARCDMAMLMLNDVFARTWQGLPAPHPEPQTEFWSEAISTIRATRPDFLFLAEAYWALEERLLGLGFNFAYDKELYDALLARESARVQRHLFRSAPSLVAAEAHFLENHDEPAIASLLSFEEHRAAALLILGLPGMRFLHHGQLEGWQRKAPVQLRRRLTEQGSAEVRQLYRQFLAVLPSTAIGRGRADLLAPQPAWEGNPSAQNFVIVQWQDQGPEFDLLVVNLAPHRSQCYAPVKNVAAHDWTLSDLLGQESFDRPGAALASQGLYLDLPAHGAQLFKFQTVGQ